MKSNTTIAGKAAVIAGGPDRLSGVGSWFRLATALALSHAAICCGPLCAQTNSAYASANRWLVIVQTSASMQPRAKIAAQIAAKLMASGMNGQMQPGDTIGLWTYNDQLYTGQFPLQLWTPAAGEEVARRVYDFLESRKYEKTSSMDSYFPDMERIAQKSDLLTVIVISDGTDRIHYTPFDDKINSLYDTWKKDLDKSNLPFVTVLRSQSGQFTNFSVTVPPWPLELPPMPPQSHPIPAEIRVVQKPVTVVPSLIISGRKPASPPDTNDLESASNQPTEPPKSPVAIETAISNEATAHSNAVATTTPLTEPPTAAAPTPAAGAAAPTGSSNSEQLRLWWIGAGAGCFVGVFSAMLIWRRRAPKRISLITRSLDREKK